MPQTNARVHAGRMAYHAGLSAEASVIREYESHGYVFEAQRWRGQVGEIDLVLRKSGLVVFVEVKKSKSFERAALRISPTQKRRIFATGEEFVAQEPQGLLTDMRFDVALVDAAGAVQILENALSEG
ncbi:putative endonuclease [Roseobacter denitrificans OCh 114]|nr:putative endonuclease [Roseobacter denitrificans OCh 114]